jgi:Lon protease-like protein
MTELPLFPLNTVLLPGGLLTLQIFETRYLDMVARCLRGDNRFGVVAIREGREVGAATPYEVGTTAEIVDWHREQSKGLLVIVAEGRETFRIEEMRREADGLYVGHVTFLPALTSRAVPSEHAPLVALLRRLVESSPLSRDRPTAYDDAVWVGARLIEVLPLTLAAKQSLLETQDAQLRLDRLAEALRSRPG